MDQMRERWLMDQVRQATRAHILPRFRALGAGEVRSKSAPDDLVTEADLACEAALTEAIHAAWPEALVVGEEAVAADPSLLDRIGGAETCVILDPVDGTWNFANGLAVFGVIVAVARYGEPVWGGLYDPLLEDWVLGAAGQGARFVSKVGAEPLSTGRCGADLTGYVPLGLFADPVRAQVAAVLPRFRRASTLRCSCHEYRLLVQGRVDFVISPMLKPWDHAAGVVAVQAAGGAARLLDGRAYSAASQEGVLLAARDEACWDRVARIFDFLA